MKKGLYFLGCLALSAMMAGCGKEYPDDILLPNKMEDLLYDYQMTFSISSQTTHTETYKKQAGLNYVFTKHGVTKAQFDSSMVWYSRHTEELAKIYENLNKRFDADAKLIAQQVAKRDNQTFVSLSGDTVNIWQDRPLYCLTTSPVTNRFSFDLKADTTFKPEDTFIWEADYQIFPKTAHAEVTMGLSVSLSNDSVQGVTQRFMTSGPQKVQLVADGTEEIRNVAGFVYCKPDTLRPFCVVVSNIRLTRLHKKNTAVAGGKTQTQPEEVSKTVKKENLKEVSR